MYMEIRLNIIIALSLLMTLPACSDMEERADPENFAVESLEVEEVEVDNSSLIIPFSARLAAGAHVFGDRFFEYGKSADFKNCVRVDADDSFSASACIRDYGQKYYLRAVFSNGKTRMESKPVEFKLLEFGEYVSVSAPAILSVSSDGVGVAAEISYADGIEPTECGFELSLSVQPFLAIQKTTADATADNISASFSSLSPGKTYYARAYLKEGNNIVYGNNESFKTDIALPVVKTAEVTGVTTKSAVCGGSILSDGGSEITAKGVVWGTSHNPVISLPTRTNDGAGTSSYTSTITYLTIGVTYYVRAYATNAKGTAYGEEFVFITHEEKYVDLGLSVKWARCNLGASSPEQFGGYYQWAGLEDVADTGIRLYYDRCPYHSGTSKSSGWTKYVPADCETFWSGSGEPDNKTVLDPEDDIAVMALGDKWRMPTVEEWEELKNRENCSWAYTIISGVQGGVQGYKIMSLKPGFTTNWIFLPTAGYRQMEYLVRDYNADGFYWSSELSSDVCTAFGINIDAHSRGAKYTYERYFGLSVRPVYDDR